MINSLYRPASGGLMIELPLDQLTAAELGLKHLRSLISNL